MDPKEWGESPPVKPEDLAAICVHFRDNMDVANTINIQVDPNGSAPEAVEEVSEPDLI